jgi:hypothetical protein
MGKIKKSNSFSLRSFTSFSLVISTIIMSWSGFILYIAPAGRIANWGDWKLMLFTKAEWQAIHTIFSYMFFILAFIHLFFVNWKTFLTYIRSKVKSGLNKKWEFITAIIFSGLFFLGTLNSWIPFGPVMTFGENVKSGWEKEYVSPPVVHMEEYSLEKLALDYPGISPEQLRATLNDSSIKVVDTSLTLKKIAAQNDITPSRIYDILNSKFKLNHTTDNTQVPSGVGKMTISQVAVRLNKDNSDLIRIVKENNIEATGETMMRTISDQFGISPQELYSLFAGKQAKIEK